MLTSRREEIVNLYFAYLDKHIQEVADGTVDCFKEINQIASELFISHQHLTDTIHKETGHHPCYFYDQKIIEIAKLLLISNNHSVAEVARRLTFDPSNFSKYFKKFVGISPHKWRMSQSI